MQIEELIRQTVRSELQRFFGDTRPNDQEQRMTTRQCADYIGISESQLAQGRTLGSCKDVPPYITIGRRVFYLKSDVDQWISAKRH